MSKTNLETPEHIWIDKCGLRDFYNQGVMNCYPYPYHPIAHASDKYVRVDFIAAARADLARKVIETTETVPMLYEDAECTVEHSAVKMFRADILTALRELFRVEGVEVE